MLVFFTAVWSIKIKFFLIWKNYIFSFVSKSYVFFLSNSKQANLYYFVKGGRGCNFTNSALGLEIKTFRPVQLVHGRFKITNYFWRSLFFIVCHEKIVNFFRFESALVLPRRLHSLYLEEFFKKFIDCHFRPTNRSGNGCTTFIAGFYFKDFSAFYLGQLFLFRHRYR